MPVFVLAVVDAATEAPYPTYTDASGESWVCGEPGKEFYVRVTSQGKMEIPEYYRLSVTVDGSRVGYDCVLETHKYGSAMFGIPKGDVSINAFKFVRHDLSSSSENPDDAMDARPGQGQIQLNVFKVDRLAKFENVPVIVPDEWNASAPSTRGKNKKDSSVLSAGKGTSTQSLVGLSKYDYTDGVQVEVQTLNYTTEFGLAVRGMHTPAIPSASTEEKKETEDKKNVSNKRKRDGDSNSNVIDVDSD